MNILVYYLFTSTVNLGYFSCLHIHVSLLRQIRYTFKYIGVSKVCICINFMTYLWLISYSYYITPNLAFRKLQSLMEVTFLMQTCSGKTHSINEFASHKVVI